MLWFITPALLSISIYGSKTRRAYLRNEMKKKSTLSLPWQDNDIQGHDKVSWRNAEQKEKHQPMAGLATQIWFAVFITNCAGKTLAWEWCGETFSDSSHPSVSKLS